MSSPDGKGRLILIRHTESAWNKLNVFTGWVDIPLSEAGREHALQVGRAIKGKFSVDKAYTSSLTRAQETLDLVMEGAGISGIPVVQDWHLNERYYGGWQGKNKDQTRQAFGADAVQAVRRGYSARPPGGESLADTTDRVLPYFEEVMEPELDKGITLLVAAHGNSLRALAKKLLKLSDEEVPGFEIANGEVLVFRREAATDEYTREHDAVDVPLPASHG